MKRSSTPSYFVEIPLSCDKKAEKEMSARLLCGTRLYNAALGEALKRLRLMRQSKAWQAARLIKDKKSKYATLTAIRNEFGFTSASISAFATECKNNADWKSKLSANETQKIAETAFSARMVYQQWESLETLNIYKHQIPMNLFMGIFRILKCQY